MAAALLRESYMGYLTSINRALHVCDVWYGNTPANRGIDPALSSSALPAMLLSLEPAREHSAVDGPTASLGLRAVTSSLSPACNVHCWACVVALGRDRLALHTSHHSHH